MKRIWVIIFSLVSLFAVLQAGEFNELQKIVAADRDEQNYFGSSVSISGDFAIVGVNYEDEDATGANYLQNAGAAYIFKYEGGTWTQQIKLVASDREEADYFGLNVSIYGDYAIVGAHLENHDISGNDYKHNAGAAYIFKRKGASWIEQQKIVAPDRESGDMFGASVFISGDYAIVGATGDDNYAGSVYAFKLSGDSWDLQQKVVASDRADSDQLGTSVSISGAYIIAGAGYEDDETLGASSYSDEGAAYIFKYDGTGWSQEVKLVASERLYADRFGVEVSISGDYALIGCTGHDYDAADENYISNAGAAYIFHRNNTAWSQQQILVGAHRGDGYAFGNEVSIWGDYAIVGSFFDRYDANGENSMGRAGAAYVFKNNAGSWSQVKKLLASDRSSTSEFGYSVSMSSNHIIAGAHNDAWDVQGNNLLSYAGAAYIFSKPYSGVPLPGELSISEGSVSHDFGIVAEDNDLDTNTYSFTVKNTGGDTLTGTINKSANWLAVSPDSGFSLTADQTQVYTVTATASGLASGFYTDTVTVSSSKGDIAGTVELTIDPSPELSIINGNISHDFASVEIGNEPATPTYSFTVKNTGGDTLSGTINASADWLIISPNTDFSLTANESLEFTVRAGTADLSAGVYSDSISIISNAGDTSGTVLVLIDPSPELSIINGNISHDFASVEIGNEPAAPTYSFTVKNTGGGILTGSISESASWLSIAPDSSFSLTAEQIQAYTVTASTSGLSEGSYTDSITISSNSGAEKGEVLILVEPETAVSYTPESFCLFQNYPNPFNPSTSISYDLAGSQHVSLNIYDLNSRKIVSMDKKQDAGHYEIMFDPTAYGLATGIYVYRLQAGKFVDTKKMVYMK